MNVEYTVILLTDAESNSVAGGAGTEDPVGGLSTRSVTVAEPRHGCKHRHVLKTENLDRTVEHFMLINNQKCDGDHILYLKLSRL